ISVPGYGVKILIHIIGKQPFHGFVRPVSCAFF
ncbi:unnamed protein product, partial [marine sediment metagenome]